MNSTAAWWMLQMHMRYVRMIYLVGYSLSLTTLAVAVAIMLYIKSVLPTTCLLALNRHTCNCRRPSSPRPHQHRLPVQAMSNSAPMLTKLCSE